MLYIRSPELTHLSDGIKRRISANVWSSDSQGSILPIVLDQTLSFNYLQNLSFFFLMVLEEEREAIPKAVSGKAQSFPENQRIIEGKCFQCYISKSLGHG